MSDLPVESESQLGPAALRAASAQGVRRLNRSGDSPVRFLNEW